MRIALVSHVGTTNLGDEAILSAAMGMVRAWTPAPEVLVFSVNAADSTQRHAIVAHPVRPRPARVPAPASAVAVAEPAPRPARGGAGLGALLRALPGARSAVHALREGGAAVRAVLLEIPFLFRSWRRLRGTRLVIIAGSNQLGDWFGGPWGFPYTVLRWCALGRAAGARVVFLGVGAGPIDARLSGRFCRWALNLAAYVSLRDRGSQALVEACGFRGVSVVAPDLAFGLRPNPASRPYCTGPARVVVNVFPYKDPAYDPLVPAASEAFGRYVAMIAEVAAGLAGLGHRVSFVCSQRADRRVIDAVLERLRGTQAASAPVQEPQTVAEIRQLLAEADFVVASRFHGVLLSLLAAQPVVALCYQEKTRELMESVEMGRFALDIGATDAATILARFGELAAQHARLREKLGAHAFRLHSRCIEQFGVAASLAGLSTAAARERTGQIAPQGGG